MQQALRVDSNHRFWSAPVPSNPRDKRLLIAGVAIAGASVIAINPVAPSLSLPAIQDRAVELSAWVDPVATWGQTVATTVENLGTLGSGLGTSTLPSVWQILTNPSIYNEVAGIISNPVPGLEQFFSKLPGYAETISSGLDGSSAGLQAHLAELPATLQAAWDYVLAGQFTRAFAQVTSWAIFGLGEAGWPLFPAFEIPGEIARDLGAPSIAKILDVLFVGDNAATGYAYSLLSPPITAIYQLTDILDVVSGSLYAGDWVTAVSEIVNAPAKILNAFLNGYQPSVAAEWETFPGLFSEGGPIDALFVKLPKAIAEALAAPSEEADTVTADAALAKVSSTDLVPGGDVVTLDVVDAVISEAEPAPEADSPIEVTPVSETVTEEVDTATTEEAAEPVTEADDATEEPADTVTETAAEEEAAEEEAEDEAASAEAADEESKDDASSIEADTDKSDGDKSEGDTSDSKDSSGSDSDE